MEILHKGKTQNISFLLLCSHVPFPKCLTCSWTAVKFFLICFHVTSLWSLLAAGEIHKGNRINKAESLKPKQNTLSSL
jgi:hypothetical protein